MTKIIKKNVLIILSTAFVVSCTNQINKVHNDFPTAIIPQSSSEAVSKGDTNFNLPNLTNNLKPEIIEKDKNIKDEKPNFDILPSYDLESVDGAITVIYKNIYKIRIDKVSKKLKSQIGTDVSLLNKFFVDNGIINLSDMGSDNETEDEMDKMQENFQKERGVDIPHLKSIHYYSFPKGTDTKKICRELMKLPLVRLAYPTPITVTTVSTTLIGNNS
ncbi:MAG: hypothetical protein AABZ74_18880 [Cyanobacteriota bacterium]